MRVIERAEGKLRELCLEQSLGPIVNGSLAPITSSNEYYGRSTPVEYCGPFTELRYEGGKYEVRRFGPQIEWSTHGVYTPYGNMELVVLSDGSNFSVNYIEPLIANLRTTVDVDRYENTMAGGGGLILKMRMRITSLQRMNM